MRSCRGGYQCHIGLELKRFLDAIGDMVYCKMVLGLPAISCMLMPDSDKCITIHLPDVRKMTATYTTQTND